MKKLAIISSHPIQHFSPLYRCLAKESRFEIVVIYYSDVGSKSKIYDRDFGVELQWDIDLSSGYRNVVLHPEAPLPQGLKLRSTLLKPTLDRENPDIVYIYGYYEGIAWQAWNWARRRGKKIVYFSDTPAFALEIPAWKMFVKRLVLKYFFRHVDFFCCSGDSNEKYLEYFGIPPSKIYRCPLTVDVRRFQSNLAQRDEIRTRYRRQIGWGTNEFVVLFSAKMSPRKRPMDLVLAIEKMKNANRKVCGILLGTGELFDQVKSYVEAHGLQDVIFLPGFINQSEIVNYQLVVDCVLLSSSWDPHPLSVTEGMACGLPVLASDRIGCVGPTDTARPGVNTLVYPCGDIDALVDVIKKLSSDTVLYTRMSEASLDIVKTQDISVAAQCIRNFMVQNN